MEPKIKYFRCLSIVFTLDQQDLPVQLFSDSNDVKAEGSVSYAFNIDASIGRKTQLTVGYNGKKEPAVEVVLKDPKGTIVDKNSEDAYFLDTVFQTVNIKLEEKAMVNMW